jgi:hypothetical protein
MSIPETPAVDVRVIDTARHRPVAGALVTMWLTGEPDRRVSGKTDAQGRVSLAALETTAWLPVMAPYDLILPPARIRCEAPGYAPLEQATKEVLHPASNTDPPSQVVTLSLTPAAP